MKVILILLRIFGKEASLTVSGQLEAEVYALALKRFIPLDLLLELRTPTPQDIWLSSG